MGALYVFLRKSLAVLYIVFFVVAVFSVGSVFVVAVAGEPPSSGDWIVTGTESYSDREIVLNGHLIVNGGGNLTFRNVTLKMNCTYKGQYSITVNGRFYVLDGSVITSLDPEREYFFNVRPGSTFRMMNSELHECGVQEGDALWVMSNDVIIENNLISNNHIGIRCELCSPVIRNNNIISSSRMGIFLWKYSNATIDGNYIMGNSWGGIECIDHCNPLIFNNVIASNPGNGIGCRVYSSPTIVNNTITANGIGIKCENSSPTIQGNTITSNTGEGIGCYDNSSPNVTDNTIILNNGPGISGSFNCSPIVQGNNITSNRGIGIQLRLQCSGRIRGNILANNSDGIHLYDYCNPLIQGNIIKLNKANGVFCENNSLPEIHWNDIYGNKDFGVLNFDSSITVDAPHNYWGSASGPVQSPPDAIDPEEVSENVLYTPWLAERIFSAEITSPLSGEMVSSAVRVSSEVHAQHGVQKVEFYIDNQLKYTDFDALYEWNWDTTQYIETEHKITAKAHDNFGLKISASITVFVDNTPPTIAFKEPLSGNTYWGTVTISVNATDNREVKDVRVKVDNSAWLGTAYNSTELLWEHFLNTTTLSDGQHTVMSLALDRAGNPATTSITIITDNNPPTLTIQSPTSGMTVGLTLTVSVQASDVSNISKVEFYLVNVLVNTAYTAPYQWAWDTTRYPNGQYTITVKAYDAIGNIRTRDVTVIVNNVEVPWWQAHFWTIVQAFIALGGLVFTIVTYWSRTRQKRKKKKPEKKETRKVPDTDN